METSTAARILARALARRGVKRAFGMPGGDVLTLLEEMGQAGIDFVLVRHEASAAFAAEATWQLTGAPGVAVATLGPGATNLLTGVAGAMLDRSAVVAVTGCSPTRIRPVYTHMALDQQAVFRPVVKASATLTASEADWQVAAVLRAMGEGRPGPVHLDLPADVAGVEQLGEHTPDVAPQPRPGIDVAPAIDRMRRAKRPVIAVGVGDLSDGTARALRGLAHAWRAPVLTTYRAKGMVPEGSPWSGGAMGLSPVVDRVQQELLSEADLLLAIGLDPVELRPNWLPGWPEDLEVIALDPWGQPDLLGRIALDLRGAVGPALDAATEALARESASTWTVDLVATHRARWQAPFRDDPDGPAAVVRSVQRALPPGGLATLDVGAHRITASHAWTCESPRTLLQSNGLSSMGSGLPYAIAARLAFPDRPVVALTGDMGLAMALGELGTVQDLGLDLVVVVLADRALSLIELKQERLGLASRGVRFANPDPFALAAAFGGTGRRVRGARQAEEAVRAAFAEGGLQLVEVELDAAPYRRQM